MRFERGRWQNQGSLSNLAEEIENIVVVGLSNAVKDLLGFRLRLRLDESQEVSELIFLGFQDLVATTQGGPTALTLFGFVIAVGSKILTPRAGGSINLNRGIPAMSVTRPIDTAGALNMINQRNGSHLSPSH